MPPQPAPTINQTLVTLILLTCPSAVLAAQPDLRLAVPLLVGTTAVWCGVLAYLAFAGCAWKGNRSLALILGGALLLRLMFIFSPPHLSDDIYRYLWDGSTVLHGINPYGAAPSAMTPSPAMRAVHARINHPEFPTIYPPAAQVVFAAGALLGGTITGIKAFLVLVDLALCWVLVNLLRQVGMPPWRAVLYAWNPLPVIEIAGSGHVDGAGLAMFLGAVCLLVAAMREEDGAGRRWRVLLSGGLLAGAGLVKLFPLALMPLVYLLVPKGYRRVCAVGCSVVTAALVLPFLPQLATMLVSLGAYARDWEFAGFAFRTLRVLTGSGTVARLMLAGLFMAVGAALFLRVRKGISTSPSPAVQGQSVLKACSALALTFLLLTPTLHPWYALSLAVFLPFAPGPAGLVLCWAVFLAYQVQIPYAILGKWIESSFVTAALFGAPVTAWLCGRIAGRLRVSRLQSPAADAPAERIP